MLSNACFLAKFRFDTAENEPAKNLQNFAKFANFADPNPLTLTPSTRYLKGQIEAFGLEKVADTRIGTAVERGLSGGEVRYVKVG